MRFLKMKIQGLLIYLSIIDRLRYIKVYVIDPAIIVQVMGTAYLFFRIIPSVNLARSCLMIYISDFPLLNSHDIYFIQHACNSQQGNLYR